MKKDFRNITSSSGIASQTGWWNSITAGDFDNDGDIDYLIGNLDRIIIGRAKNILSVYMGRFDNNGILI